MHFMFRSFIIDLALGQNIFENSIKKQMQDYSTAEQLGQTGGYPSSMTFPKRANVGGKSRCYRQGMNGDVGLGVSLRPVLLGDQ